MMLPSRSTRRLAALCAAAAALSIAAAPARAQGVLVAPQAVFVDHRTRSGAIELYNPGTEPAEVTVSALFGYPVTDSLGRTTLYTTTAPDSSAPSAAAWVSAFPRRLTLAPRQRQTVRLLVRPPQNLPDADSYNVIADLPGTDKADEIVIVSGHLDSWDLATGAHDDAVFPPAGEQIAQLTIIDGGWSQIKAAPPHPTARGV